MDMGFRVDSKWGMWTPLFLFPVAYCANKYEQTSLSLSALHSCQCVFISRRFNRLKSFPHKRPWKFLIRGLGTIPSVHLSNYWSAIWQLDAVTCSETVKIDTVRIHLDSFLMPKGVHLWACIVHVPRRLSRIPQMKNDRGGKWAVRYRLWSSLSSGLMWCDS